jgi:type IV secretory pathway VirB2 component (pilin)
LEDSLSYPGGSSALVAAVGWLQGTLLGTIATAVATICVAGIGLMMLSGRVPVRRGLLVILGCFILFGASTIAAGIEGAASAWGGGAQWTPPPPAAFPPYPPLPVPFEQERRPRHSGLQGEYPQEIAPPSMPPPAPAEAPENLHPPR